MNETLAQRVRRLPRTAQRALASRATWRAWRTALEGVQSPDAVARAAIARMDEWLPLVQWTLAVPRGPDVLRVVAHSGARLRAPATVEALARQVAGRRQALGWASVKRELGHGPDVGAIGFLLMSRNDPVAVLIGLDDAPADRAPAAGEAARGLAEDVLGPAGAALEVALRLERLQQLAAIDDLTGLYNARYLYQAIDREIHRLARTARPVSLLFMDLDAFKRVNDSHGHLMGSRALVEFGALLRGCTRATDTVARYGGDEFVVVLPETDGRQARLVARRIRERVAATVFLEANGLHVQLSASAGLATLTTPHCSAAELIRRADEAMYWVKHHGRNGIRAVRLGGRAPRGSRTP